jgi:hypothetical protein
MDIEEMEAGREMDALVASKVFDYFVIQHEYRVYEGDQEMKEIEYLVKNIRVPEYSTDIQLIWSHSWVFKIWRNNPDVESDFGWIAEVYAPTAPLAICRAALKAVEG